MKTKEQYLDEFSRAPLSEEDAQYVQDRNRILKTNQFDSYPSFGTGGMREVVELGTNRLNIYNIARLNYAVSKVFKEKYKDKYPLKAVIGYDSRLTSEAFANLTWNILTQNGYDVFLFRKPTPTPMVSFAVLEIGAVCGIVLTASHNPPQYNGYKVYDQDGSQIIYPMDEKIQHEFLHSKYDQLPPEIHEWLKTPDISDKLELEEQIIDSYLEHLKKEKFVSQKKKDIKILYSPLHGTGGWIFERAFSETKFTNFALLKEQSKPDGNFPHIKSPNPEDHEAYYKLIQEGKKKNYDILLATDPDADRIGCCVLHDNEYVFINGNQTGCLLLDHIARIKAFDMENPYICKTVVTTELQKKIASSYGIETKETLTGFKYIASVLKKDPANYLFGGEESFGYLPVNWIKDKDSVSSGIIISELASQVNLITALEDLYIKHGLYTEILHNIQLKADNPGIKNKIEEKLKDAHSLIGTLLGDRKVKDVIYLQNKKKNDPRKMPVTQDARMLYEQLPEAKLLQLWLEPEGRVTIRPSGTEPKIKVYVSLMHSKKQTKESLTTAKEELAKEASKIYNIFSDLLLRGTI